MKQVFCFLFVLLVSFANAEKAHADNITLDWSASDSPSVTGYNVYYGTNSGNYPYKLDAGDSTSATISNLTAGVTYYFAATAYDESGEESPFSAEITFTVPGIISLIQGAAPGSPASLQFPVAPGHSYEVQATTDLQNWTSIWQSDVVSSSFSMQFTDPDAASYSSRFYRLVIH